MRWIADGKACHKREDGKYRIFRGPAIGHSPEKPIVFQLVDCGTHEVLRVIRDVPNEASAVNAAMKSLAAEVRDA
jgi:hypothetical protein